MTDAGDSARGPITYDPRTWAERHDERMHNVTNALTALRIQMQQLEQELATIRSVINQWTADE